MKGNQDTAIIERNRKMMKSFLQNSNATVTCDEGQVAEFLKYVDATPYTYEEMLQDFRLWCLNKACGLQEDTNMKVKRVREAHDLGFPPGASSSGPGIEGRHPVFEALMGDVMGKIKTSLDAGETDIESMLDEHATSLAEALSKGVGITLVTVRPGEKSKEPKVSSKKKMDA